MPWYAWRNKKTAQFAEVFRPTEKHNVPPDDSGDWERVYAFGVGRVEGGGGSPARTSLERK